MSATYDGTQYNLIEGENSFTAYDDYQQTTNKVQKFDVLTITETTLGSMEVENVLGNSNNKASAGTGSGRSKFSASTSSSEDSSIFKAQGKRRVFLTFGTSFEIGFKKKKK